ncbi:MAG: UDP-N-acetylmuramoyl-tripeptide--D-alanyl-D-alanine ligase [Fusobacteria bacterium]|nr:UDP-N-acetylmuramoyl-tripeptide--D-alanyl-D-alanine ligase [Fusobacteriota bacterium]
MIEIIRGINLELNEINLIKTNSQEISEGDIFVAINSGNKFVEQALKSGAKYAICERTDIKDEKVISVKNSLDIFTKIAKAYRDIINPKVIGITGSNGKTSVKDILAHCLCTKFKVHKTYGNHNNHIGVPITLCSMPQDTEVLITEIGMSDFGEIDHLAKILRPDIGIITNIGESHLEMLKTKENVLKAKAEIIPYSKKMMINLDDEYLSTLKGEFEYFSIKSISNFMAKDIKKANGDTFFDIDTTHVVTNLMGIHNVYNILAALRVCKELNVMDLELIECLKNIEISKMRMEKIAFHSALVINDAYNASPKSTLAAIETVCEYYPDHEKIVVIGDMLELGEDEPCYHRLIIEYTLTKSIERIYFYGERYYQFASEFENEKTIFTLDKKFIAKDILLRCKENVVIMLKASRGMKLEEIIK